jgi:hypothetical protein
MKQKFSMAMSLAVILAMLLTSFALADDISNNLDASIDAVAEAMPLNVGGANGTTQLYVTPRNGDDKNGCNLTGSTTLVVAVSSSNTSVATVSPNTVTFTSCGDTPTLTISPVAQGSATISASLSSNTSGGSFDLAPVTFTVNVAPPANTAPTVVVAGVDEGASYNKGSVPAATCQVTDAEDGNRSFAATLSAITGPYASDGIGSQTASCSYTDGGGLTASASETYSIVDPSVPVISYALTPSVPDGSNGWYKSNVTLVWTVTESESLSSLAVTGCDNQNIIADQDATTYSCSATSAGGTAEQVDVTIKRDGTAPVGVSGAPNRPADNGTWYNHAVDVVFAGTDAKSGIATCSTVNYGGPDGLGVTVNGSCTDMAGNTNAPVASSAFDYDGTAPTNVVLSVSAGTLGSNSWYISNVTIHTSSDADISGVSCTPDQFQGTDTAGATFNGSCTNGAGLTSHAAPLTIKLDKSAPIITDDGPTAASNGLAGWYVSAVVNQFSADGAISGLADPSKANFTVSSGTAEGSAVKVGSGPVPDNAGNTNTGIDSAAFKIDLSNPSLACPSPAPSFILNQVGAQVTATVSDAISGPASLTASTAANTSTVGTKTANITGYDNAGRSSTVGCSYSVVYNWSGFFQPIDMNMLNTVKSGSGVPVKFSLGGDQGLNIFEFGYPRLVRTSCTTGLPEDAIETTVTAGYSSLTYDALAGQYIYVWKTDKAWVGTCGQLQVKLIDGTVHFANFKFK